MKKLITIVIAMLLITVTINAQNKSDYSSEPGYVNFGDLSKFMQGDRVTEINLEANILKMLSKLGGEDDPDFNALVGNLKLIRVNSFGIDDKNQSEVMQKIASIDKDLTSKKWERIVKVKDRGENTNIYILPASDYENVLGLVVASVDDNRRKEGREATFVNIVGKINMEQLGKLGDKFNIPTLGRVKTNKKDK